LWCAQTFPLIFGLFAIFDRNFAKKMWRHLAMKNENYVVLVHLKEQSSREKSAENRIKIDP